MYRGWMTTLRNIFSTDGGANWTSVPGPNVTIATELDDYGYEWEVMTNIPSLYYPLDDGAIPGLYN